MDTMFEKSGKFYADWRDRKGVRHRKSFKSERAALAYEAEMREVSHPKHKAVGQQSRGSSPTRRAANKGQSKRPADSSSLHVVRSTRDKLRRRT